MSISLTTIIITIFLLKLEKLQNKNKELQNKNKELQNKNEELQNKNNGFRVQ